MPTIHRLPDGRPVVLARYVEHDERSKRFPMLAELPTPGASVQVRSVDHGVGPRLDQGHVGSCHDPETEILTRRGWLPFPDLTLDNEVATVDPATGALIYEKPTRVVQIPFTGDMHVVKNARHDFMVTPDHMMLVRPWNEAARTLGSTYELRPMKDIGWYSGLMVTVDHRGAPQPTYTIPGIPGYKRASQRADLEVPTKAWLRFLGIYLAEGTMLKPTAKAPNKIQLAAVKDREKKFIGGVLADLGVRALEFRDRFTFENARIYQHLQQLGLKGVYAVEKFVPDFVFGLPAEDISAFLQGHREGDGCLQADGTWTHYTSSPRLADDLQRLVFLAGGRPTIDTRAPKTTVIRGREIRGGTAYAVRHNRGTRGCIERKKDVRVVPYSGTVYCAEVPTFHTLVTRRNGKILISGNCTGNEKADALNTQTLRRLMGKPATAPYLVEDDAYQIYCRATRLDNVPGVMPPSDTGSTGIAACKATLSLGYMAGAYRHTFTTGTFLKALMARPAGCGSGWTEAMFSPDRRGYIAPRPGEEFIGGHQWLAFGFDEPAGDVLIENSWGRAWGLDGLCRMRMEVWTDLIIRNRGDVTFLDPTPGAAA